MFGSCLCKVWKTSQLVETLKRRDRFLTKKMSCLRFIMDDKFHWPKKGFKLRTLYILSRYQTTRPYDRTGYADWKYPISLPYERSSWSKLIYFNFEIYKFHWPRFLTAMVTCLRFIIDNKFQWPQDSLNSVLLTYQVVKLRRKPGHLKYFNSD